MTDSPNTTELNPNALQAALDAFDEIADGGEKYRAVEQAIRVYVSVARLVEAPTPATFRTQVKP